MEIEYTPQQPKPQAPPQSSYVLVNDLTGKPPPLRGAQTLKAYTEVIKDGVKKQLVIPFKVPHPPKTNCKKCKGRGYVGLQAIGQKRGILYCPKCYANL